MSAREMAAGSVRATLFSGIITTAIAGVGQTPVIGITPMKYLAMFAKFVYGSAGTSVNAYVQTSLNAGVDWFDIANFAFTTASATKMSVVIWDPATPFTAVTVPGSGALTANTVLNGMLGDRVRVLLTTVGTYAGNTTLAVDIVSKG